MSVITKSIIINAPIEKVYEFMNDPKNLPEIWPSMVEIKNVRTNKLGGYDFGWVYKMAGLKFEGESISPEVIKNKKIVTESTKGIRSKFVWSFDFAKDQTHLTVEVEYTIPNPLLNKLADGFITKSNETEAESMLKNLKIRMES